MDKIINKKTILIVTTVILLIAISSVFAFYNDVGEIENAMKTATSEMVLNEIFNENDQWVVGETKQKEVSFENTGEIKQFVRFTVTEKWLEQDEKGDWVERSNDEDNAATVGYTDYLNDEWTKIGDYYYYNSTLNPNTMTNIVIDDVTFSSDLDNGGYGSSVDYSDKRYSLTIKMEAIEVSADVASSDWNVDCNISGETVNWSESSIN